MDAHKISLTDYILSGGGYNGESYHHRDDPSILLKLYYPGKIRQPLNEVNLARKVFAAGIPTPEPGEYVVTEDGRYGIRFKRIEDKVSYARACGDHPEKVDQYAAEFAHMCRQLHATHVDTSQFPSVKEKYISLLDENPFFSDTEKGKLKRFILQAPDTDTAIHGDLQFGNAIFAGGKRYFIDLGDFCYGHPYFDLGMVYLCCKLGSEDYTKEHFHMDADTASRFYDAFIPAYFGPDCDPEKISEILLPYAGLKTLIIERDANCPKPEFRKALQSIL